MQDSKSHTHHVGVYGVCMSAVGCCLLILYTPRQTIYARVLCTKIQSKHTFPAIVRYALYVI